MASSTVKVEVEFDTKGSNKILQHKTGTVALNGAGKGTIQVEPDKYDLILFAYQGPPGTKAKITLTPPSGYKLDISSHPIQDHIAQGKLLSGGNRFFRVRKMPQSAAAGGAP